MKLIYECGEYRSTIYLQQVIKNYLTVFGLKTPVVSIRSFDDSIIQRFDFIDMHHDFNTNSAYCMLKLEDLAEFAIAVTCMGDRVAMNYDDETLKQYTYLFPTAIDGKLFEQLLDAQALCNEAWVNSVADREGHDKAADMLLLEPLFNEHFEEEVAAYVRSNIRIDGKLKKAIQLLQDNRLTNKLIYAIKTEKNAAEDTK